MAQVALKHPGVVSRLRGTRPRDGRTDALSDRGVEARELPIERSSSRAIVVGRRAWRRCATRRSPRGSGAGSRPREESRDGMEARR